MAIKKVLVVDDSATERHVLGEVLGKKGFQVVYAESGEKGVASAKSEMPDLILMDVVMPGLNGFQATRAITQDDATKHHQRTRDGQDLGNAPRCQGLRHKTD
jgi:twitching motility two-component system response regulator PilH